MKRCLLLASAHSYRTAAYQRAATDLGIELLVAAPATASAIAMPELGIRFSPDNPDVASICNAATMRGQIDGIAAADDEVVGLASEVAAELGLIHNPPEAMRLTRRKDLARQHQRAHGVKAPDSRLIALDRPLHSQIDSVSYPCVIKPVALSASRGVIRANTPEQLVEAAQRVARLLRQETSGPERFSALVEDYLPGREVAVEGFVEQGVFSRLVTFDKPDPLEGPYFEETYYVTPATAIDEQAVDGLIQSTITAYGLVTGPVHAECRVNEEGVWLLELAARTIGGDCASMFEYAIGFSLEQLVLTQAVSGTLPVTPPTGACGVLMIPVPGEGGVLRRVEGISQATKVPFVERVQIDVREGAELTAWPEGGAYPGFVFARAPTAEIVVNALRDAHECLEFVLAPRLNVRVG